MEGRTVSYLGEADYRAAMDTACRAWREEWVRESTVTGFDGARLRAYTAQRPEARGAVVLVHGFCEFFGKYHEMAWYFWQAGYSVYFLEQRGHGYSQRFVQPMDLVHVNDFSEYTRDLEAFITGVVQPAEGEGPLCLLGHSMGGAVAARLVELHPGWFRRAVLSAPMLGIQTGLPGFALEAVRAGVRLTGSELQPAFRQEPFSQTVDFSAACSQSRARFDYQFAMRLADERYRTNRGTFGWVLAGVAAGREILAHAGEVTMPVLLLQAGLDTLVEPQAQNIFAARGQNTVLRRFPRAKHEIFNGTQEDVRRFYEEAFAFLEQEDR